MSLLVALLPLTSRADTLQGQFDWSGTAGPISVAGTPPTSGTAYFVYDTTTDQGTITGLPTGYGDTGGVYDFSAYYHISDYYEAFPITSFSALTTDNNGESITPTWIISSTAPVFDTEVDILDSGHVGIGNLLLQRSGLSGLSGTGTLIGNPDFAGTTSNFVQAAPEPSTDALYVVSGLGMLLVLRRRRQTNR